MDTLADYRSSIDNLDAALIALLAERFKITRQVGLYKARAALPERDAAREQAQMEKIDRLSAAAGLRPEVAQSVLRIIIDHVVDDHRAARSGATTGERSGAPAP